MMDLFDLSGKRAVVVGGAGGIGQAIAQGLAEAGADVSIASRKEDSLRRAQSEIKAATGIDIAYYTVDASDEASVQEFATRLLADKGGIDILVNSQGYNAKHPATEFPMDVWDDLFTVNVKGFMMCCKEFGKRMKEQGHGKIINVSSVRGARAIGGGNTGYCATKGAVDMLTRTLAVELGPEVHVNAIGPTLTYTPMMAGILPADPAKRAAIGAGKPLQRIGEPEDCVGPAIFLASAASDFVTGQILYPDGGLTAVG